MACSYGQKCPYYTQIIVSSISSKIIICMFTVWKIQVYSNFLWYMIIDYIFLLPTFSSFLFSSFQNHLYCNQSELLSFVQMFKE